MRRYRLDALEHREGRLYFGGAPFDGIAYEVVGDRVVANHLVSDGLRVGPAEPWDENRDRAVWSALTFVEEDETTKQFPEPGAYLNGVLFEGVAYGFDHTTGVLLCEEDARGDAAGPSREWYESGVLRSHSGRVLPDGYTISESFYRSGLLRTVEADQLGWGQTADGRLRTLRLYPGYREVDLATAPTQVDTDLLGLTGKGVTDDVLKRFTGWEDLAKLYLSNTGITAKGLETLRVCSKLQELLIYEGNEFTDADVQELNTHLPNCRWRKH